jgi:tetratricopeptide (TPR) repeat protein
MNQYDFDFVKNIAIFAKDKKMYEDILNHFYRFNNKYDLNYYSIKAQDYEKMGLNDEALDLWFKNIEEKRAINHIFYYRRPYELLLNKLEKPEEAIQFLENSIDIFPEGKFYFNYYIAKAAIENNIQRKKAKSSLQYCLNNFENNPYFSLEDLQNLSKELK